MAYDRNDGGGAMYHRLTMEGREKLTVAGVEDVERFDENCIVMSTCAGTLVVTGEGLHIGKLSLDGGELHVLFLRRSTQESGSLHERILGEDALELIMTAATDPAPELDAVPIERLRGVPMCLLRSDDLWGYNDYLMKECRRSGFEPNVPCQCYDTPMAMQLVRSGFGISFLPHSIVETHPNSGIYAKPLRGIPAKSYPVLVWSDDVLGAPCVQRFIAES